MTGPDYDSDSDPLAYMTTSYGGGWTGATAGEMSRRATDRGRRAPKRWARIGTWVWIISALSVVTFSLVFLATVIFLQFT